MAEPFVVSGGIARQRGWILGDWLNGLSSQTHRPDAVYVLLNDCTDNSEAVLRDYAFVEGSMWGSGPWLSWDKIDTGAPGYERTGEPRYSIENLAHLRNAWVERCLARWPQSTHLWSCDSDVLPDPDVLELLLAADKPVCAAVVRNSTAPVYNFGCGVDEHGPRRSGTEASSLEGDKPFRVTYTGACVLMRRDVAETAKYAYSSRGEDIAWCRGVWQSGWGIYVHPLARTSHWMDRAGEPLR